MSRPGTNKPPIKRSGLRIAVPSRLPSLSSPPKDPFASLSVCSCKSLRLKPSCPGKRIVLSAGKDPGQTPFTFLFSPRGLTPSLQSKANLSLAPIKVKRRSPSLMKCSSVKELGPVRPHTPNFRKGLDHIALAKAAGAERKVGLCLDASFWKSRTFKPEDTCRIDVSFGLN
jgi:hypothetical protein